MKKFFGIVLMMMLLGPMAACGGNKETAQPEESVKEEAVKKEENKVTLIDGYWVAESLALEGTEFSKEDMESIFGPAETVMTLAFDENGIVNGILFGEFLKGSYTESADSFEITFETETTKGTFPDGGKIKITLGDGSDVVLVKQTERPEALDKNPWVTYDVNFTAEETAAMSNFMSLGRYYIDGDVMYGLTHKESNTGGLGATKFEMVGDFPEFEETKVLDGRGIANCICKDGDYLYYVMEFQEICRIKTDGSELETLYEGACDYLQIYNGRLYFTDADSYFVSTDMDGNDLQTVVDKEIYYPYFICEDWLLFQDDADEESIHIYNTKVGEELNITYMPTYNPIIDGKYLYVTVSCDEGFYLLRLDMSDPYTAYGEAGDGYLVEAGFMMDDTRIYATNDISELKEDWKKIEVTEPYVDYVEMYVSEKYTIHHDLDEQGFIIEKTLMSKERNGGSSFN